eukprot:TRINITY_DN11264_c0_g1_i1.p1 TRINITY_DN11264_c0_g1~~TRINITY_DN11264_c0_g1_i1.p1  ORF type:complete len:159 (-),score=43.17 TRINITY_DN11264_c0_g1_i1:185-661(-)
MGNHLLQLTEHCIIGLSLHQSFFVVMLDVVELVYFERAKIAKTFDLVLVTKESGVYNAIHITHISASHLDNLIQNFNKLLKIKVSQGPYNLDWVEVFDFIREKPEDFAKFGWQFLENEDSICSDDEEDSASDFCYHDVGAGNDDDDDDCSMSVGEEAS